MVDMFVPRKQLAETIGRILSLLMQRNTSSGKLKPLPSDKADAKGGTAQPSGRGVFTKPGFGSSGATINQATDVAAQAPANDKPAQDKRNVRKATGR